MGDLLAGTVVSVYVNGTTTPPSGGGTLLSSPIYPDGSSSALLTNPFTTPDGNVSFYLDASQRVDLGIQPPGGQLVIYPDIDVEIPSASSAVLTFPGSGPSSTQVGNAASASQAQAVALGDTALASGPQATAAGQGAQATATAATALGQGAIAAATDATAVGQGSSVPGSGGTAVGQGAGVTGPNSTAIGEGASAAGTHSTALGAGASASVSNQVVLGTAADDVALPGGLSASQGGAQALSNGSTITFAGSLSVPVTASGNVTGLILAANAAGGQLLIVNNESAFTLTFAAAGTSNVADGASDVIAALTARIFVWDGNTLLWYRVA